MFLCGCAAIHRSLRSNEADKEAGRFPLGKLLAEKSLISFLCLFEGSGVAHAEKANVIELVFERVFGDTFVREEGNSETKS